MKKAQKAVILITGMALMALVITHILGPVKNAGSEVAQSNDVQVMSDPPIAAQTNNLHFEGLHANPTVK